MIGKRETVRKTKALTEPASCQYFDSSSYILTCVNSVYLNFSYPKVILET